MKHLFRIITATLLALACLGWALAEAPEEAPAAQAAEEPAAPAQRAEAAQEPARAEPETPPASEQAPEAPSEWHGAAMPQEESAAVNSVEVDWSDLMLIDESGATRTDCAHFGSTRESIIPLSVEYTCTPYAHTKAVRKRVDTVCDECGSVIHSVIVTATDRPQGHRFVQGVCRDCGYACAHDFDAEGRCRLCGQARD